MEVLELAEVLEVAEELLDADDLTAAPRLKDCSLRVWVLVVPAAARAGLTRSLRANTGFGAVLGGVFLTLLVWGLGRQVLVVDWEEVEAVSSSLVKVPCLTRPGGDWCRTSGLPFL